MPSLILTALSVIIVAFALVAGTNYVNPAVQGKVEVSRVLAAQYAAIGSAISSYRIENSGVRPTSMKDIEGYIARGAISGFGKRSASFAWTITDGAAGKPILCLTYAEDWSGDYGTYLGLERFALDSSKQRPEAVSVAPTCSSPSSDSIAIEDIASHINETRSTLSVLFEEF
jgi:hypothetical protein